MRKKLSIFLVILPLLSVAQFAPPAGQEGTTAMHADSSAFVAWATGVVVEHGPMDITHPDQGVTGPNFPDENALGFPDGTMGVVCLGDGGKATLTFDSPIYNGPGPDFAVFENGFANAQAPDLYFLELAFVEVSSDGVNFFRFPAYFNAPQEPQLGSMGCIDPSLIHNLASKYAAMYGTPFDLDEVEDNPLLDKNKVTHVRLVDVVGCTQPEYATFDCQGHVVNDPWPTPFASSGFDLDAVGVIYDLAHFNVGENQSVTTAVYPNPVSETLFVNDRAESLAIYTLMGQLVLETQQKTVDVSALVPGLYLARVRFDNQTIVNKFFKK